MAEILSQAEIDALIQSMLSGDQGSASRSGASGLVDVGGPKRVRTYDFRRPDKFSKEQLRTIQMIHENMTRYLSTYFAARFRTMVQMVIGSVDQNTYSDFIRSVSNPSVLCPFSVEPLPGTCVIDVNPIVAFPMIDRLFGGPGAALQQNRALTEIETSVMQGVIQGTLSAFAEVWSNIITMSPKPGPIETNPLFVQVAAPSEIVVTIAIDVRIGEHVGVITLCIPHLTLEPILPKLSAHSWFQTTAKVPDPEDTSALQTRVGEARVPVTVELGRTTLAIRDILELARGDVLMLDTSRGSNLTVFVGNQPKFVGQPGRVKGRLAIEITGFAEKGDSSDE
jgi:flagellar motor switch protein FliM